MRVGKLVFCLNILSQKDGSHGVELTKSEAREIRNLLSGTERVLHIMSGINRLGIFSKSDDMGTFQRRTWLRIRNDVVVGCSRFR